jgi:hypothetical protein
MTVSDMDIVTTLMWELEGDMCAAIAYSERLAAVDGPLAAQYQRVTRILQDRSRKLSGTVRAIS